MTSGRVASERSHQDYWTLGIVYVNVVLYATCFQMQRPLEPFLVEKLSSASSASDGGSGGSIDDYAKLQSFFSIVQTFGSLVAGFYLDRYGAKGGFLISFGGSALSYWILSQSNTMNMLYLSKIPTIFQAGFLCAQLAATLVTNDGADRVQALGTLTMCYTIGSVAGPAIGGWLGASGDYYFGATLAVYGSVLSMFLTLLMPSPASTTPATTSSSDDEDAMKGPTGTPAAATVGRGIAGIATAVWIFLTAKVVTSMANSMSATAMPLIFKNSYGLNERDMGLVMSSMSGVNAVVNGLFLGPIVRFLGSSDNDLSRVVRYCLLFMMGLSFLQAALSMPGVVSSLHGSSNSNGGMIEYVLCLFALSVFQYILATSLTGESTARVEPFEKGTLLGMEHSLFAAARTFTPQAGVWLLKSGGVSAVSATCGTVFAAVLAMWLTCIHRFKPVATGGRGTEERKEK